MNALRFPIAAITDEFSPNLARSITFMKEIGMTGAELRVVNGKNILDLTRDELAKAKDLLQDAGIPVVSIASPLLKCVLPGAPEIDKRFQHDIFASTHTYDDQPRLTDRAFEIAHFFGAKIIRVFSYWRTVAPEKCLHAIVEVLTNLAKKAAPLNLIIGLENEHACNVSTAEQSARVLDLVQQDNLGLVWDPANALVAGENPFPLGYGLLPKGRIVHVHAKDCHIEGEKPVWGPLGTRHVDWKGQINSLVSDGYHGYISLETHWLGPNEDKAEASRICGWNLRGLVAS
jgi:sugar phosphate isomerase/epimerase